MGIVIFNGQSSASFHAHVSEPPEYKMPERDYEAIHVNGRNGDLLIDNSTYQNVEWTYKMNMDTEDRGYDYSKLSSKITTWLHPWSGSEQGGYYRLQDSYDPTHYRLAKFKGGESISNIHNAAGEFDLTFECKPQRFLLKGDKAGITRAGTLNNPTAQIALPRIVINVSSANGYLTILNSKYNYGCKIISTQTGRSTVDSRTDDCYDGSTNRNSIIQFRSGVYFNKESYDFPKLYPGDNVIAASGLTFTIYPYWWEL